MSQAVDVVSDAIGTWTHGSVADRLVEHLRLSGFVIMKKFQPGPALDDRPLEF